MSKLPFLCYLDVVHPMYRDTYGRRRKPRTYGVGQIRAYVPSSGLYLVRWDNGKYVLLPRYRLGLEGEQ